MITSIKKTEKGMTLVEIMVAFTIVTTSFIAILQAFPTGLAINQRAEMASVASYLAQDKIEEIWSQDYDTIATGTVEVKQRISADPSEYLYNFQRETTVTYIDGTLNATSSDDGLKSISTTIYYTDSISKTEKSYNITTLVSQR